MTTAQVMPQCSQTLKHMMPELDQFLAEKNKKSFYFMPERKINEHICWVAFLSGYHNQSAKKAWPGIKSSFFYFSKFLVRIFGLPTCVNRAGKAFEAQAKISVLADNLKTAFSLSDEHSGLKNWLNKSDNIFKELTLFKYIGPTNVKQLLDLLGFADFSQSEKPLLRVLFRLKPAEKPGSRAGDLIPALKELAGDSRFNIIETYTLLKLFSELVCTEKPSCFNCHIDGCPSRAK